MRISETTKIPAWISYVNLALIVIQLIVLVFILGEVLAFDYGWEGRMNTGILFAAVGIHVLFTFLIKQMPGSVNKKNLLIAVASAFALIVGWIVFSVEVRY